jgi:hypothetical protein
MYNWRYICTCGLVAQLDNLTGNGVKYWYSWETQRGDPVGFSNELRVSAIPGGLCIYPSPYVYGLCI